MEFGAHLPQIVWPGATPPTVDVIVDYVSTARALGFTAISANDHLVHRRPWFDSQTGLALALPHADGMTLATTVGLPVVRGPSSFAKTFAQLDHLSDGRVLTAVSAGSSPEDYAVAGIPWEERWKRLDESIGMLRALWGGEPFSGRFYASEGARIEPEPARAGGPPIWVGSWGSERGLKRVATLGDGWLASAYNTTPPIFAKALSTLRTMLTDAGREASQFPNSLATMMFNVTEDATTTEFITNAVASSLNRSPGEIAERLMVGPPGALAEKVARYEEAGLQRMFLWPVDLDSVEQLRRFGDQVFPLLG